jgi:prepilin-type N-terminal cleavage/methylation domain-containing protein
MLNLSSKKGFTLIELLIVVAIIAILAASVILIAAPGQRIRQARESTRESHMIAIATAINLAVLDCKTPASCADVATFISANCPTGEFDTGCAGATKIEKVPRDPANNAFYKIAAVGTDRLKIWTTASESKYYGEANAKVF